MSSDSIKMRKLSADDLEQYNDLLRYAFQLTERTLLESGWENDEIRKSKFPVLEHANVVGCFDGDTLVSQFAVYPLEMNVHGNVLDIGFITSVATYPEYTGKGLMSKLMKQSLCEMRERGQTLSLLYPYSIPLYRHRGWEIVSDKMSFRVRDHQLPKDFEVPGHVRRVAEDSEDLMNLHREFAEQTHGCIFRNKLAWEEYWRWEEEDITVAIYYSADEKPLGYMVYQIKDDIMFVKEMIYLNMEARKGLWKYIAAHDSMIDEVQGSNYWGEPIAYWFYDSEMKETIRPYIMGRIIDVENFISLYRFDTVPTSESITFHVRDPFLEWNNLSINLVFAPDGSHKAVEEVSPNQVDLDIGTLTALLLGYIRPSALVKLEKLQVTPKTLALLEDILIDQKAYISDYI